MSDGHVDPFRFEITIDEASEHNFWSGLAMDIEEGGVFVATYQPLHLGSVIEVVIHLQGEKEPLTTTGIVRWTRCHHEGAGAGIGLKFEELSEALRDKAARFARDVREPILFELDETPMRRRRRVSAPEIEERGDRAAE